MRPESGACLTALRPPLDFFTAVPVTLLETQLSKSCRQARWQQYDPALSGHAARLLRAAPTKPDTNEREVQRGRRPLLQESRGGHSSPLVGCRGKAPARRRRNRPFSGKSSEGLALAGEMGYNDICFIGPVDGKGFGSGLAASCRRMRGSGQEVGFPLPDGRRRGVCGVRPLQRA